MEVRLLTKGQLVFKVPPKAFAVWIPAIRSMKGFP